MSGVERVENAEIVGRRTTVVTALPLKRRARARLAELLDARVVDIRDHVDPDEPADVVLTPACSPQLIGGLGRRFPGARVVVVELDDWEFDIELAGPVKRILRAGADAYLLADSVDELAAKLVGPADVADEAAARVHELATSPSVDDLVAAFLQQSVEHAARYRAGS